MCPIIHSMRRCRETHKQTPKLDSLNAIQIHLCLVKILVTQINIMADTHWVENLFPPRFHYKNYDEVNN